MSTNIDCFGRHVSGAVSWRGQTRLTDTRHYLYPATKYCIGLCHRGLIQNILDTFVMLAIVRRTIQQLLMNIRPNLLLELIGTNKLSPINERINKTVSLWAADNGLIMQPIPIKLQTTHLRETLISLVLFTRSADITAITIVR